MSIQYCTVADIKRKGRLDIIDSDYDVDLDRLITAASQAVDKYCNVPDGGFQVTDDTTHYYTEADLRTVNNSLSGAWGVGSRLFFDMPCLSITTLTDSSGHTFSTNQYRLGPYNYSPKRWVELLSMVAWSWTTDGRITVVGKFGYATTPPDVVVEATAMYAAWMFKRWQAALQDATANQELGQIIYGSEMPKQVKALLGMYTDYAKIL